MDNKPYEPSEAWKKYHAKHKSVEPAKEPDGEYSWQKMLREEKERAIEEAELTRSLREDNSYCPDDEDIMNDIMDSKGYKHGFGN